MATKNNVVTTSTTKVERDVKVLDNDSSRKAKNSVRGYFDSYEKQLSIQWDGLKKEDTAFKALNAVIAGIAGGQGEKPYIWLIKHFSRYIDANEIPCNRRKGEDGRIYFKIAVQNGVTARGLLKKAALNCIESQRLGNRFSQTIVVPE